MDSEYFCKCYQFCFCVKINKEMKSVYLFSLSVLLWKVSFLIDFFTTSKIYVLYLVFFQVTTIQTIWSIAVLFPLSLNYPGSSVSFPDHLTPHWVDTPALHPQKILCTCGCFYSWKLTVLLNSYRKLKRIGISRVEEAKEHSSLLIIGIITVVIYRYGISLKLNAVRSSVNPECKSS